MDAISARVNAVVAALFWFMLWILCRTLATILVVVMQSSIIEANTPVLALAAVTDVVRFLIRYTRWPPFLLGVPVMTFGLAMFFVAASYGTSLLPVPTASNLGTPLLNPTSPMLAGIEAAGRAEVVWALTYAMLTVVLGALLWTASIRNAWLRRYLKQTPPQPLTMKQTASGFFSLLLFLLLTWVGIHVGVVGLSPLDDPAAALDVGWWRVTFTMRFAVPCFHTVILVVGWSWFILNAMELRKELRRLAQRAAGSRTGSTTERSDVPNTKPNVWSGESKERV